jgi:hypothetical protein
MDVLLRRWVEWRGRRKAAQVIIFDGAAEYEKTRSFLRGMVTGALGVGVVFALAAPTAIDPRLMEEVRRRETIAAEASARADQAAELVRLCLRTASGIDSTLAEYQHMLAAPGDR